MRNSTWLMFVGVMETISAVFSRWHTVTCIMFAILSVVFATAGVIMLFNEEKQAALGKSKEELQ